MLFIIAKVIKLRIATKTGTPSRAPENTKRYEST